MKVSGNSAIHFYINFDSVKSITKYRIEVSFFRGTFFLLTCYKTNIKGNPTF